MSYINAVLSDIWVQVAFSLAAIGVGVALARRPRNAVSRKHALWVLWAICFGVLAVSSMRREATVLAGGLVPSASQLVPVPIKGTVRYVSQELAYRHDASMLVLLFFGLIFVAAYKLARLSNEA
jgi:hypothetical protein